MFANSDDELFDESTRFIRKNISQCSEDRLSADKMNETTKEFIKRKQEKMKRFDFTKGQNSFYQNLRGSNVNYTVTTVKNPRNQLFATENKISDERKTFNMS